MECSKQFFRKGMVAALTAQTTNDTYQPATPWTERRVIAKYRRSANKFSKSQNLKFADFKKLI
jgi:hypothetical protein